MRLAQVACGLVIEGGIGSLTMRSVADQAGVTPPAVVYHFGNRDKLLLATLGALRHRLGEAYRGIATALAAQDAAGIDAHAMVCAALIELAETQGRAFTASDDLARALAVTAEGQAASALMTQVYDDGETFWRSLPGITSLEEGMQILCVAVASGLISYLNLETDGLRRNAIIVQLVTRLFARLRGEGVTLIAVPSGLIPLEQDVRPDGKQQIVEATIRLAGRLGIAGLTHRNIASEAGLSAAATTYFYPTKDDIVIDAARLVQARAIDLVLAGEAPPPEFMSRITLDENGEERADLAALTAFMSAAASQPDLGALAETFRQIRGLAAVRWLRARGYQAVDRVDGILWSSATTSLTQRALLLPVAQRAGVLDRTSEAWLARLFGKA